MRFAFLLWLVACDVGAEGRIFGRDCSIATRRTTRGGVNCTVMDAGTVYTDAGTTDLNGFSLPLALQCDGSAVRTENGTALTNIRASVSYCQKSDGTVALLTADQPKRERTGLHIERASQNDVGTDGAKARDLSDAAWTKASMTCAKTATGADSVANAASTCTSSSTNGSATYAVTAASAQRATTLYIKRRTGAGTVIITRDNFDGGADVSASLSSTVWKRVRSLCGVNTSSIPADNNFRAIDNCIQVVAMTATAANPIVGIKLGTSGDAVDVDFVQDELDYPSSPMAGFARAADFVSGSPSGLPGTSGGEMSMDFGFDWTPGTTTGTHWVMDTGAVTNQAGITFGMNSANGNAYTYSYKTGVGQTFAQPGGLYPLTAGNFVNWRMTWGNTNDLFSWADGHVGNAWSGTANIPNSHTRLVIADADTGGVAMGGWVSRMRFTAGAVSTFHGSVKVVQFFGDSIVNAPGAGDGLRPHNVLSGYLGGNAAEKYVIDYSISGYTIDQCKTAFDAQLAQVVSNGTQSQAVFVLQCGLNSSSDGAASVLAKLETMLGDAKAAGIGVIGSTITPALLEATFINTVNSGLRAWGISNSVTISDTYAALVDPLVPGRLNPTYDTGDGEHLNAAGAAAMTAAWYASGVSGGQW